MGVLGSALEPHEPGMVRYTTNPLLRRDGQWDHNSNSSTPHAESAASLVSRLEFCQPNMLGLLGTEKPRWRKCLLQPICKSVGQCHPQAGSPGHIRSRLSRPGSSRHSSMVFVSVPASIPALISPLIRDVGEDCSFVSWPLRPWNNHTETMSITSLFGLLARASY